MGDVNEYRKGIMKQGKLCKGAWGSSVNITSPVSPHLDEKLEKRTWYSELPIFRPPCNPSEEGNPCFPPFQSTLSLSPPTPMLLHAFPSPKPLASAWYQRATVICKRHVEMVLLSNKFPKSECFPI